MTLRASGLHGQTPPFKRTLFDGTPLSHAFVGLSTIVTTVNELVPMLLREQQDAVAPVHQPGTQRVNGGLAAHWPAFDVSGHPGMLYG